jgi:hypothetical protein
MWERLVKRVSSRSNRSLSRRDFLVLASAAVIGACIYLLVSALTYRLGFPLDDSWIHATYARNLAQHGQWAFRLGIPSAGSTAPLWALLLTPGFFLHLSPLWWSYILGAMELFLLGVLIEVTARRLLPSYQPAFPWAGLFTTLEWHMLWAATSGMETLLQGLLASLVLALVLTSSRRYLAIGLLTGLSVWVRPDGLTLALPVVLVLLWRERSSRERAGALLLFLIGLGSLILPYLVMNLSLSGTPLPNTFYAKQAEYAAWQSRPLLYRLLELAIQLSIGPSVLLLPGAIAFLVEGIRRRHGGMIAVCLWCGVYCLLYILRLPPYQHARYLMPAMPVYFLIGFIGFWKLTDRPAGSAALRIARSSWRLCLVTLAAAFVAVGARAYGEDVGLIESEMVDTARWVAGNIPENAVIAAHDIGALGFYDDHRLIDLAGLVSPEVIPFMRDEGRLASFLDIHGANYLIAFPGLYPALTRSLEPIHLSGGRFAPAMGQRNMAVYCWSCPR